MLKAVKIIAIVLVIGFIGIQFVRPKRTNPPIDPTHGLEANTSISPNVLATLHRACFDCHSHQSRWPAYSQIAPISWLVVQDVNNARGMLNFSEWSQMTARRKQSRLDEICRQVRSHGMPLSSYLLLHHDARLSPADIDAICAWTEAESQKPASAGK